MQGRESGDSIKGGIEEHMSSLVIVKYQWTFPLLAIYVMFSRSGREFQKNISAELWSILECRYSQSCLENSVSHTRSNLHWFLLNLEYVYIGKQKWRLHREIPSESSWMYNNTRELKSEQESPAQPLKMHF